MTKLRKTSLFFWDFVMELFYIKRRSQELYYILCQKGKFSLKVFQLMMVMKTHFLIDTYQWRSFEIGSFLIGISVSPKFKYINTYWGGRGDIN